MANKGLHQQNKSRILVAVSGGGRSLANLLAFQNNDNANFCVTGVISSKPGCGGEQIALASGLPLLSIDYKLTVPEDVDHRIKTFCLQQKPDLIVLAGYLKPFPVLPEWRDRIVNIHPALLPKFGGKGMYGNRVHQAVLAVGEKISGATIHLVSDKYDEGRILARIIVDVKRDDTTESLAARVFAAECLLYPDIISRIVGGELRIGDVGQMPVTIDQSNQN